MRILVKSLQGEEYTFDVKNDLSVHALKVTISENVDCLPVDRQRLVFKGRAMQDGYTLRHYGIVEDSKIHLIIRKKTIAHLTPLRKSLSVDSQSNFTEQPSNSTVNPYPMDVTVKASFPEIGHTVVQEEADRKLNMFEVILRERLAKHFPQNSVDRILADLHNELDVNDTNTCSIENLEQMARDKLNITND